jgi:uncharacterized protein (TIGR02996 family)
VKDPTEATEAELLAAIAAQPDDHTRLVYADWLLARGDRRGELIQLDVRERTTPGGLSHPDQMASLLRLAAELGFPYLPDPDAELLPFEQLGRDHDYQVTHDGHHYQLVRRDRATLVLTIDHGEPIENTTLQIERRWTDQETNVVLSMVSHAIRAGTPFATLWFPTGAMMLKHPAHRLGPLPVYYSAEIIEDFDAPWMLRARDHARWYAIYDRMMAGYSRTSPRK